MLTQLIPPTGELLAQMPTGREIHTIKPYQPPLLDAGVLESMRAPPDRADEGGGYGSSDEEAASDPVAVGAFLGTHNQYRTGTPSYY